MIFLPDVNVLLSLAFDEHSHHQRALTWFDSLQPGEAVLCRVTQMSLMRLLTNTRICGKATLNSRAAWRAWDAFSTDERVTFSSEPRGLERAWRRRDIGSSFSAWTDAYLLAFAETAALTLVTFDTGFRNHRHVRILS